MSLASPRAASRRVVANGLEHHVLEWPGAPDRTVVVLHGYLDLARSFGRVGDALAAAGHRVLAPDFRGHGESAWVPAGGYYHFPDYVADLAALLDALAPPSTTPAVALVGHSMGGTVATLYAGTRPSRVRALVLAEGVGPQALPPEVAPERMERWLQGLARARAHAGELRRFDSLADVVARLRATHGGAVPEAVLTEVAALATRPHPSGTGLAWRFDPLHQTTSPARFELPAFAAFARRITAPVLLVDGGASGYAPPDAAAREALFAERRKATLDRAGHMMHWTRPDALAEAAAGFLREVGA